MWQVLKHSKFHDKWSSVSYIQYYEWILLTLSWLILFFEFDDMDVECTNSEFYMGTLVYVTVILIHVNFCLNSNLVVKNNVNLIGENAIYLIQNYSYFSVMYIVVLINKVRKHW